MSRYRVSIDRKGCIGDAICTALCQNWYMDSDGKASFRNELIVQEEYDSNREASISCPTGVIKIDRVIE